MTRIGEVRESAMWFAAGSADQRDKAMRAIEHVFALVAQDDGLVFGPVTFTELTPGDDQVPEPPAEWLGEDPALLVGEAEVRGIRSLIQVASRFVDTLDGRDLLRLRALTRVAHQKADPLARPLTDFECDEVIERVGPASALATLREAVDQGVVH